jgi:hypothetical protein
MSYFIHFNNPEVVVDITGIDNLAVSPAEITADEIDVNICRETFTLDKIYSTIEECSFYIYKRNVSGMITGLMTITDYPATVGHLMEITFICVSLVEAGGRIGTVLLDKLKQVTRRYDLPITLYGLGTSPDSRKLYGYNGFTENKFTVSHGKKRKTKRKGKGKRKRTPKRKERRFELVIS